MPQTFQDYGLQVAEMPSFKTLRYESPVNLTAHNQFSGDCSVGAFSYVNPHGEFHHTSIGRFCSIAGEVCAGPGQHNPHAFSTHPFHSDSEGAITGLGQFESYRKIQGRRPLSVPEDMVRRQLAPEVRIGHDVWIGMRAIIMAGVTIGHGAVVAAGAVVTKDVAPYTIVAGVPARVLRARFAPAIVEKLLELRWWDYDMAHVSNQVDFGRVEQVIEFMTALIKSGRLPRFAPKVFCATRSGNSYAIASAVDGPRADPAVPSQAQAVAAG
jgi:virginiamycin A acetyltransferase